MTSRRSPRFGGKLIRSGEPLTCRCGPRPAVSTDWPPAGPNPSDAFVAAQASPPSACAGRAPMVARCVGPTAARPPRRRRVVPALRRRRAPNPLRQTTSHARARKPLRQWGSQPRFFRPVGVTTVPVGRVFGNAMHTPILGKTYAYNNFQAEGNHGIA